MANVADLSWSEFFAYFIEHPDVRSLSPAQVVARLNPAPGEEKAATARDVSNWRRCHSRPMLSQLPALSEQWAGDPYFFARLIGAIPRHGLGEELDLQRRITALRTELHSLEATVRSTDSTQAVGRIVAETLQTERWAVAVYPAIEGPTGIPVRVADRLDFRRVDGADARRTHLEADLGEVFRQVNLLWAPTAEPRWSTSDRDQTGQILGYSFTHTTPLFSPTRLVESPKAKAIAVTSLTLSTWPFDVAALVARMLGYGFASTRALTRGQPGVGVPSPADDSASQRRTAVHRHLLREPWQTYVWGHYTGRSDPGDFLPDATRLPNGIITVWLRETEELLTERFSDPARVEQLLLHQRRLADQVAELHRRGHVVFELPCGPANTGDDPHRHALWDRTFDLAAQIVDRLLNCGAVLPTPLAHSLTALHDNVHHNAVNQALYTWLQRSGWLDHWRTHNRVKPMTVISEPHKPGVHALDDGRAYPHRSLRVPEHNVADTTARV